MRHIEDIVVHSSATKPSMDIGVDEIRQWHLARKFRDVGYHYIIRRCGEIELGRNISETGAHVRGHNKHSIGICMVGGLDEHGKAAPSFTQWQWAILADFCLLYTSPSPRDQRGSRMPSSA